MMTEERLICFDTEEIMELARGMSSVKGLELPDRGFFEALGPMAVILAEEDDPGIKRFLFTVSVSDQGDDLIKGLWSNAALNSAALIMEKDLRREAEDEGLVLSELKAPGLAGLPVELTRTITRLTHADRIGVSVNATGIMFPAFTKCGFYLAGTEDEIAERSGMSGCAGCMGGGQGCALCIHRQGML